jgi:hypothetical protein
MSAETKELRTQAEAVLESCLKGTLAYGQTNAERLVKLKEGLHRLRSTQEAWEVRARIVLRDPQLCPRFTSGKGDGKTLTLDCVHHLRIPAQLKDDEALWLWMRIFDDEFGLSPNGALVTFKHPDLREAGMEEASKALERLLAALRSPEDLFRFMLIEEGLEDAEGSFTLGIGTAGGKHLEVGVRSNFFCGKKGDEPRWEGWDPEAWKTKLIPVTSLFSKWFRDGEGTDKVRKAYLAQWLERFLTEGTDAPLLVAADKGDLSYWQSAKEPVARFVLSRGAEGVAALLKLLK